MDGTFERGERSVNVGDHYRATRERLTGLLGEVDDQDWRRPVPACPGWDVQAVVSHLVGVIEDGMAGRLDGPPTDDQTADEVRRHRDDQPADLLARWDELAPTFEAVIARAEIWPAAFDALSHEHDVRAALDRPAARTSPEVAAAAAVLVEGLEVPATVRVITDCGTFCSASVDGPSIDLRTSAFEVLRLRLGRRSRQQVIDLDWSRPPPHAVVDGLFVFGPRSDPLLE